MMITKALLTMTAVCVVGLSGTPAFAAPPQPLLKPGDRYVALGDSYASGSGTAPLTDPGCLRSQRDYPALLAQQLGLALADVTCSAATIPNLTDSPQQPPGGGPAVPPQISTVTSDTRLVTITVGGNDINQFLNMTGYSCLHDPAAVPDFLKPALCRPVDQTASANAVPAVEAGLLRLVGIVRQKAPTAQIVLTDWLDVLPTDGTTCAKIPLTKDEASFLLTMQGKLSLAVASAARQSGARLVSAALIGASHDACASTPWTNRFVFGDFSQVGIDAYHPNAAGNQAVADAIYKQIKA